MKKVLLLVFLAMITTPVFCESIIVLDFDTEIVSYENNAVIMSDMLRSELVKTGAFDVIDKKSMASAIATMKEQFSEYRSEQNIKQLGKMLNADYLVIGHVMSLSNSADSPVRTNNALLHALNKVVSGSDKVEVIIQIINIETLQVLSSSSVEMDKWTDFSQYISLICNELIKPIKAENDVASKVFEKMQTTTADMFEGTWTTEVVHDGFTDTYELEFNTNHTVTITLKSVDKKKRTTTSTGTGRFIFNDTDKILTITINSFSGEVKHVTSVNWKTFVTPSDDFDAFTCSIPVSTDKNTKPMKVNFFKID